MKNFGLIGAAGYIAPRHLQAVKETGNRLLAALDRNDSVGIIDSYFPEADFFVEPERFDRHLQKLKYEKGITLDYLSICTPNYLHDAHIRLALRNGSHAICEKPLVLNPWNVDALINIEKETGLRIWNILQLRLHPSVVALKQMIESSDDQKVHDVDLAYITARGNWYYTSWKGSLEKSGGVATNIGIHFFDMLCWIFGGVKKLVVHQLTHDRAAGYLELDRARVRWFLSIDENTLPDNIREKGQRTYRSLRIGGEEFEFSTGFTDLHTVSYQKILKGHGFGIAETLPSIHIAHDIRFATPVGVHGEYHPFAKKALKGHPFGRRQKE